MSRKFQRLGTDSFPYLDTVGPFKRKNEFDYARYDYTATAKLLRVTWPSDYKHVVDWESEESRDAWFDKQSGNTIELTQGVVRAQTDRITLDIPYDVALTYNYVFMRVPQLTKDRPIDYERSDGMRTICAFINSVEYQSPSVTEFIITVDVWTTYLPYKSVHGCILDRGHAPMLAMSAADYLERPIDRCANLLAPDVNFGEANVVRGGVYKPLSTAQPMYVLASTIPYASINSIATASNQSSTPPSYYDLDTRDGYQVGVSGYQWASGRSYANMNNPSTPTHAVGSIPTGLYYYGILGSAVATGALATLFNALPVFALSCKAAFVVPSDLVTLGTTHTVGGVALREVSNKGAQTVESFALSKQLFDYPERYADIAKLYTEPYAHLEISDDLGNSVSVAIEDTRGSVDVVQMLSIAFPALEWRAFVTNTANTAGNVRYNWTKLDGSTKSKSVTNADFANTLIEFGIPTYALYLEARTEQALTTWANAQQRRDSALLAYQSTMRSANTARANAVSSDATAKANADRSANTAHTNAYNSANNATANTNVANNLRTTLTGTQNTYTYNAAEESAQNIYNMTNADVEYTEYASDANLKSEAVAGISTIAGAALSGNVTGAVQAGVSSIVNITTSAALAQLSEEITIAKQGAGQDNVRNMAGLQQTLNTNSTTATNASASATAANNESTAKTNATNTRNTSQANAAASQSTGDANATYSRNTTMTNAKGALENAQQGFIRELSASGVLAPNEHGSYSGSSVHEIWENRGIHLRAVTQTQGAIKQAGDTFLRYGYNLGAAWEISAWVPDGARYCYWQSTDLWQRIDEVANAQAERLFESILAAGVTVWKDPEEVGRFEA